MNPSPNTPPHEPYLTGPLPTTPLCTPPGNAPVVDPCGQAGGKYKITPMGGLLEPLALTLISKPEC